MSYCKFQTFKVILLHLYIIQVIKCIYRNIHYDTILLQLQLNSYQYSYGPILL